MHILEKKEDVTRAAGGAEGASVTTVVDHWLCTNIGRLHDISRPQKSRNQHSHTQKGEKMKNKMPPNPPPMTTEAMTEHLQNFCCTPVVLRKRGETVIQCPCCRNAHEHACPGHSHAHCESENRQNITMTNGRDFTPNCRHTVHDHKAVNDHCEL